MEFLHRRTLFSLIAFISFSLSSSAQRSNCSVAPYENTVIQPDGSALTLLAFGNEAIHYLETKDGFTVLKNPEGYFEYATIDAEGNLTNSGIIARNGQQGKAATPHLRYSHQQKTMMMELFAQMHETEKALGKAGQNPFPPTGIRKLVVILVEYPNLRASFPKENFELLLNQPNYNGTGSFRDFYLATSNGKLDIQSTVYGWVMAKNNYKYYGRQSSTNYSMATRELLLDALKSANDSFDVNFSEFDNDKDGYVDGVIILHAGLGAEETSAPNSGDYIWSFRSTLPTSQQPTYDGVKVSAYAMFPEKRYSPSRMVGIGVMCHEFGHLLDLPDLYSTAATNEGAGNYSLMAGGPWLNSEKTPCFNDAWSRIQMGWVTPTLIATPNLYTLEKAIVDTDVVYQVKTKRPNEYFLLENRQKKGFDSYLPSKGLAIWHINSNYAQVLSINGSNNVNNDASQLGVGLIQADGLRELELDKNRGNATDLYPQTANNSFGPETNPASNLHYKVDGVRQPSMIAVNNITQLTDGGITFNLKAVSISSFASTKIIGCAPLGVEFTNTSVGSDSFLWDFGYDNQISTLQHASFNYINPGTYRVKLTAFFNGAVVDSSEQSITVHPNPVVDYTYEREDDSYTVRFTNKTTYANYYQWVFNGTVTSTTVNPVLTMSSPGSLNVKLTAYGAGGCESSKEDVLTIFALGVNNNVAQQLGLKSYPNPFINHLFINLSASPVISSIELYNVLGERVYILKDMESVKNNTDIQLNLSDINAGVYILKVNTSAGQGWIKVVKE